MDEIAKTEPGYVDEQDPTVGEALGFHVQDIATADWCLSRVADLELEIAENERVAAEAIARIEARLLRLNDRAMKGVKFFRGRLAEWANLNKPVLLKGGKKKSRALVHGVLAWRSKGGGLEVVDAEALLEWARNQPVELGLVRIKEEPALRAICEHAEKHNLIPPGMAERQVVDELKIEAVPIELARKEQ